MSNPESNRGGVEELYRNAANFEHLVLSFAGRVVVGEAVDEALETYTYLSEFRGSSLRVTSDMHLVDWRDSPFLFEENLSGTYFGTLVGYGTLRESEESPPVLAVATKILLHRPAYTVREGTLLTPIKSSEIVAI